LEAIDTTRGCVTQTGVKEEDTVGLYVNRHFTTHVLGMSSGDSQRLLTALFDHINQPEFQVRFRWQRGTVAMWDNPHSIGFRGKAPQPS
jgi:taurine dioxygenase